MSKKFSYLSNLQSKLSFLLLSIAVILASIKFFPIEFMKTNELADNPQRCPYYVSLQSLLANYPLLASDKANLPFIKQRMAQFESDLANSSVAASVRSQYRQNYLNVLKPFAVNTINTIGSENLIIPVAQKAYPVIDNYYLDSRVQCVNSLYEWNSVHTKRTFPIHSRRILQYNLASLYQHIPSRYLRILGAAPDAFQLGIFSGFFVNNQTTSLNIQFMAGMPLLTALYVLPGDDFANMGSYAAVVPWNSFHSGYFLGTDMRKILNIAGIDVFTVEKTELGSKKIPGTVPLQADINKTFSMGEELQSFINTESYGMAYLANHINYEDPKDIRHYEHSIKRYFARPRHPAQLVNATNALYQKLRSLKEKHDIFLEVKQPTNLAAAVTNQQAGLVDIKGIVGERALFHTNCTRQNCVLVFNSADAPGWHAFVNGKSATITRANFAFMATTVPNGHATVWFIYQSLPSLISYFISLFSLIGICLFCARL